ncbi:coiled-coil domain-containing protein 7 isoform X2 [Tachyglossus aculeatus]|uniref:coiled-coil domain-containing protein 7 isoform X2 n=1 Tax=Tachyglossus aculeatus TaxID=9261 RepID=UPI0018F4ED42|nr:coiled-coil domain-containing protein 7 isoform X2 [Tachyglossus aculeatus]
MIPTKQMKCSCAETSEKANKKHSAAPQESPSTSTNKKLSVPEQTEPMIIVSPPSGECLIRYAIPIPSDNSQTTHDLQMLRQTIDHLSQTVSVMQDVYAITGEGEVIEEVQDTEEEERACPGDDMTSFFFNCSSIATQLQKAVQEEEIILESLNQWFQQEVTLVEKLGQEQNVPDWELPLPDKTITKNITKIAKQVKKLEELKDRLQKIPKPTRALVSKVKPEKKKPLDLGQVLKDSNFNMEEFIKTCGVDIVNILQEAQDDDYSSSTDFLTHRLHDILKIFERQSTKLQRVLNEQDILEDKYRQMQNEYQLLAEEKMMMDNALKKLKGSEQGEVTAAKCEKAKRIEKEVLRPSGSKALDGQQATLDSTFKESENIKMKRDLLQAQKTVKILEAENKALQEKLQQALQGAEKAKEEHVKSASFSEVSQKYKKYESEDTNKASLKKARESITKSKREYSRRKSGDKEVTKFATESAQKDIRTERRSVTGKEQSPQALSHGTRGSLKSAVETKEKSKISQGKKTNLEGESSRKETHSPAISDLSQLPKMEEESPSLKNKNKLFLLRLRSSDNQESSKSISSETQEKSFLPILSTKEKQVSSSSRSSVERDNVLTKLPELLGPEFQDTQLLTTSHEKETDSKLPKGAVSEILLPSDNLQQICREAEFQAAEGRVKELERKVHGDLIQLTDLEYKKPGQNLAETDGVTGISEELETTNQLTDPQAVTGEIFRASPRSHCISEELETTNQLTDLQAVTTGTVRASARSHCISEELETTNQLTDLQAITAGIVRASAGSHSPQLSGVTLVTPGKETTDLEANLEGKQQIQIADIDQSEEISSPQHPVSALTIPQEASEYCVEATGPDSSLKALHQIQTLIIDQPEKISENNVEDLSKCIMWHYPKEKSVQPVGRPASSNSSPRVEMLSTLRVPQKEGLEDNVEDLSKTKTQDFPKKKGVQLVDQPSSPPTRSKVVIFSKPQGPQTAFVAPGMQRSVDGKNIWLQTQELHKRSFLPVRSPKTVDLLLSQGQGKISTWPETLRGHSHTSLEQKLPIIDQNDHPGCKGGYEQN